MGTPILVTGAAGRVGAVGRTVTELLLKQGKTVRAMVRREDERAQALRDMGAEVVVGDLLDLQSMHRAIAGCETMYFGMSVSDAYLAATVNVAAVAKHYGVKAFINMSQMTLSQMSITETTTSPQHKLQWLSEQALNWSGLPVVHVRPTVFLEGFFLLFTSDSVKAIKSNQTTLRRRQDFTSYSRRRCTRSGGAAHRSAAAHRQDLPPDRPSVREHEFLCTGVFEGAWPHDNLSGHSGRAVEGCAARARHAGSPCAAPRDDGRSAPRGALRPDVGRRAHADGASTDERAGVRQEKCRGIHSVGKSGVSIRDASNRCERSISQRTLQRAS